MSIPSKIIAWRFVTDAVCLCWRWRIYFWTSTVNLLKVDWHIHLIEWNLINLSVSVLRCVVGGRTNSECVKYAANELKLKISGMYTQSNGQGEMCLLLCLTIWIYIYSVTMLIIICMQFYHHHHHHLVISTIHLTIQWLLYSMFNGTHAAEQNIMMDPLTHSL